MKKIWVLLGLILFSINTNAIQDINITIDGQGFNMCLTQNFINHTCNSTNVLTLDGTQDHFVYITPQNAIGGDVSQSQTVRMFVSDNIYYIFTGGIVFILASLLVLFPMFVRFLNGR